MNRCTCVVCTHFSALMAFREEVAPARDSKQIADEVNVLGVIGDPALLTEGRPILADAIAALALYGHLLPPKAIAPLRMVVALVGVQRMLAETVIENVKSAGPAASAEQENPSRVH